MKRTKLFEMAWVAMDWQRPFELEAVTDLLTHLAAHAPQTPIVIEVRGGRGRIQYFFGADQKYIKTLINAMRAHGNIRFSSVPYGARVPVNYASQLKISKPSLSLRIDTANAVIRAGLAALLQPKGGESVVLQVVLGQPHSPRPVPSHLPDPHASWLKVALGEVGQATADSRSAVKDKCSYHGFSAVVRLGGTGIRPVAEGNMLKLLSALRTLSSAGVNIGTVSENAEKLNTANIPWHFPMKLSVMELSSILLFPSGDSELPGIAIHPKQIMPPEWYRSPNKKNARTFAVGLDGRSRLSISPEDSKEHTIILGPIGSGKSTAMQHLILSDIYAGKSVMVLDPKADLVESVLSRIPPHREKDVIVIDPSSDSPVGLNPFSLGNYDPGLIADAILSVFQEVFKENWGIRSQDVLSHALLTLAKCKGASLLWLPTMLTDEAFRKKITAGINDKIGLEAFWTSFESMKESERRQEILPVLNKIRQFLLRPGLRNILGQSSPKFNLAELFDTNKPRIVLVSLNKGLIGSESAKLLGSLIVGLTWTLTLSRAGVPPEKRKVISVFIDELQDYIALPTDLSDALAQARGLGVGLTLAHQYREQLPPEIRAGVDANARNKICFGVSAADAKSMAAMAPELEPEDFMSLPRYSVYTTFMNNKRSTGWISGKTLPETEKLRNPNGLRAEVAARYGKSGAEVEQEYWKLLERCRADSAAETDPGPVGRKEKK